MPRNTTTTTASNPAADAADAAEVRTTTGGRTAAAATGEPRATPLTRLAALCEVSAIRRGTLCLTDAPYLRLCLTLYPEEFAELLPTQRTGETGK